MERKKSSVRVPRRGVKGGGATLAGVQGAEPPPGLPVELFFQKSSTGNGRISRRKGRVSVQIDDSVKRLGKEKQKDYL